MKYYIIAGEASGDLHGFNLMKGILKADPKAEFRFWGGDRMAEVGGVENLVKHYKQTSFFGVTEVLKNLRTIFGQLKECKDDLVAYGPDVLVCVDYPGFNFKVARFAHQQGIRTFYYISPKCGRGRNAGWSASASMSISSLSSFPLRLTTSMARVLRLFMRAIPLWTPLLKPSHKFLPERSFVRKMAYRTSLLLHFWRVAGQARLSAIWPL